MVLLDAGQDAGGVAAGKRQCGGQLSLLEPMVSFSQACPVATESR